MPVCFLPGVVTLLYLSLSTFQVFLNNLLVHVQLFMFSSAFQTMLTQFSSFMFSATIHRGTRSPLRIGLRATRDSPELSRLVVGRQIILTTIFCYIELDRDWYQLRQCCCHLFIFWHFPAAVPDPPVAFEFGPENFSDIGSISDDSG